MRIKKIIASILLSLTLVATMIPTMAFAEETQTQSTVSTKQLINLVTKLPDLKKEADKYIALARSLDATSVRMLSYAAMNMAKQTLETKLDEMTELLTTEIWDSADDIVAVIEKVADAYDAVVQKADEIKTAYNDLKTKYQTALKQKIAKYVTVNTKTKTVKVKLVRKKKRTVRPITITLAIKKGDPDYTGKVTYKGQGINKKSKKALKINKKTGKITIKKGTKKGTYKMKVTVTAPADKNYKAVTLTKTIKIRVR